MKGNLGTGHRYYQWGDHWGWMIGFSRHGLQISTPIGTFEIARRTKWYGEMTCRVCGQGHSGAHPDPCLGELPGVVGACCGHGDRAEAYIGWGDDGLTVREFIVDDGAWKLDLDDWIPEPGETELPVPVSLDVFTDVEMTDDDYANLGRMVMEMAKDSQDRNRKIQRAVR